MWKANLSGISSLIFAGFNWVSDIPWQEACSAIAALITAGFAAYHYYWKVQEIKQNIQNAEAEEK